MFSGLSLINSGFCGVGVDSSPSAVVRVPMLCNAEKDGVFNSQPVLPLELLSLTASQGWSDEPRQKPQNASAIPSANLTIVEGTTIFGGFNQYQGRPTSGT
jgi:hypothetical protein